MKKALTGTVGTTQQTEQEYTFTNVGLGGLVIKKLEQGTEKGLRERNLYFSIRKKVVQRPVCGGCSGAEAGVYEAAGFTAQRPQSGNLVTGPRAISTSTTLRPEPTC